MVHVKVRIFSQAIPDRSEIELDDGSSLEILLERIKEKVIHESPGLENNKMVFLNNRRALIVLLNGLSIYAMSGWKTILQEGDEVSFLPMVAGGSCRPISIDLRKGESDGEHVWKWFQNQTAGHRGQSQKRK